MAWDLNKEKKVELKPEAYFKKAAELPSLRGLKVLVWGDYATGKTYLGESGPEPVYVVDTEFGAAKVAKYNFPDKDIRIFEAKVIDEETGVADFSKSLAKVTDALTSLKDVETGTIVLDSISDIYTWMNAWVMKTATRKVSARTGEEYIERLAWQERNENYYLMMMRLLTSHCNVVVAAKEVPIYGKRGQETGSKGPRWMIQTPYWCDCVVHIVKSRLNPNDERFYGVLEKLRQKRIVNMKIENITFDKLVKMIKEKTGITVEGYKYEGSDNKPVEASKAV